MQRLWCRDGNGFPFWPARNRSRLASWRSESWNTLWIWNFGIQNRPNSNFGNQNLSMHEMWIAQIVCSWKGFLVTEMRSQYPNLFLKPRGFWHLAITMDFAPWTTPFEKRNNEEESQQIRTDPKHGCQESIRKGSRSPSDLEKWWRCCIPAAHLPSDEKEWVARLSEVVSLEHPQPKPLQVPPLPMIYLLRCKPSWMLRVAWTRLLKSWASSRSSCIGIEDGGVCCVTILDVQGRIDSPFTHFLLESNRWTTKHNFLLDGELWPWLTPDSLKAKTEADFFGGLRHYSLGLWQPSWSWSWIGLDLQRFDQPPEINRHSLHSPMTHKKPHLPEKICIVCKKPFKWRKKWEKVWEQVKYCSEKCRKASSRE